MKNFIILLIGLFLIACSPSKIEQAILDHEQNFDGVKTDLKMKINSLEQIGNIKGIDSLTYCVSKIDSIKQMFNKGENIDTISNEKVILYLQGKIKICDSLIAEYGLDEYSVNMKTKWVTRLNDYNLLVLQSEMYNISKDSILANIYQCNYTILNPLLSVNQTIDKIYYFTPEGNHIIGSH